MATPSGSWDPSTRLGARCRQIRRSERAMDEFRDKVAVVTGAASGIGLGLARRFAAEGMKVVLADIEQAALDEAVAELTAAGHEALAFRTDVSDAAQMESLADRAVAAFGRVNVLCNNAG